MDFRTEDLRIATVKPLVAPAILTEELPATEKVQETVFQNRNAVRQVLFSEDHRLVAIVGPCSIHDAEAALDYASRLAVLAERFNDQIIVVMRTYFEKPRTVGGWKGLINDPFLDGSYEINKGLRIGRKLMLDINEMGLPVASEFLDNILPQFIADLVSWVAIGARTTESQIHRQFASGCSMPVGFKNATDGDPQTGVDAVRAAAMSHWFPSVTKQGISAIMQTTGNDACHLILRGGYKTGPNYGEEFVEDVRQRLASHDLPPRLMIDCSHGNSNKDYKKQICVVDGVIDQLAKGSRSVLGVMIESNIVEGRQDLVSGQSLTYGQSITDSCVSIEETERMLAALAEANRKAQAGVSGRSAT